MLAAETNENGNKVSDYLLMKPRILRDACQSTGRDDGGRLCPGCCVRDLCERQAARAVAQGAG